MPESVDGLSASGPRAELRQQLALYAPFIGSWDVVSILHRPDGRTERREGEWNWGWILEGRGIQDVFIIPARGKRLVVDGERPQSYGTTVRLYDSAAQAWRIVYMDPAYNYRIVLTARRQGDEIVQEGTDDEGNPTRWVFFDIQPTTFRWRAEVSTDQGKTWRLEQEMLATRKTAVPPTAGG
jgi:hypothetical protein